MRIIYTCPKCGHDLVDLVLTTNPPIPQKKCFSCGWEWTGEPEEVMRVPFGGNTYTNTTSLNDYINTTTTDATLNGGVEAYLIYDSAPCKDCSNNPNNGGSGVCLCTLGQQVTWI